MNVIPHPAVAASSARRTPPTEPGNRNTPFPKPQSANEHENVPRVIDPLKHDNYPNSFVAFCKRGWGSPTVPTFPQPGVKSTEVQSLSEIFVSTAN